MRLLSPAFATCARAVSSMSRVAATLWNQPAVREAAVQAAKNVSTDKDAATPKDIKGTATTVNNLQSLGLPVG